MSIKIIYFYFKNNLKQRLASRARIFSNFIEFIAGCIFPLITWYSFIEDKTVAVIYVKKILMNYLFFYLFSYSHYDDISSLIVTGSLNIQLLKPHHILNSFLYKFMGGFFSKVSFALIPSVIFYFVFCNFIPSSFEAESFIGIALLIFFLLLLLGITFLIGVLIGSISFWIGEIWPIRLFFILGGGALAGTWFPFEGVFRFFAFLPFGLLGAGLTDFLTLNINEKLYFFTAALVWFIVLLFLTQALWKQSSKKYEAEGG